MHTRYFDLRDTKGQQKVIEDRDLSGSRHFAAGRLDPVFRRKPSTVWVQTLWTRTLSAKSLKPRDVRRIIP